MDVIETRIDKDSEEYKANYAAMEALVTDLKQELKKARDERPQKDIDRLANQGKLPVRKKLDLLLDKNTPFLEIAPLAARGMYDGKIHGAGLVAGIGVVEGHEVIVVASDAMIKGGAVYPMGVKKNLRCQTICMENRLPMVNMLDSAGAYLPLQSEIFPDADDGGRIFYNQAVISKMGIPQITAVMGLCTAGGAYVPAMSDEVVHVKGTGAIFLGGPPLVKAATGEEVTADELGGAMVHCSESGVSDYFAEDDAHAVAILRKIVRGLPKSEKARLTMGQAKPPLYDPKEIYGIVSRDLKVPYDCREVIARIVDGSEFLEFKELYGPTLVCGFAYIHGYPVGILGNNGILFLEQCAEGHPVHPTLRPAEDPPGLPPEYQRLHHREGVRAAGDHQGRPQDGECRFHLHGPQVYRHRRGLLRGGQLRDVRPGLFPPLPLDVAQRPDRGHGRRAGRRGPDHP